jgi:hypothetical protein
LLSENSPIPIAVGCADYAYYFSSTYWIYPVEFTPSCSGVFRDSGAAPPQDNLGNVYYPDYLISNALFGVHSWTSSGGQKMHAPMDWLSTFPATGITENSTSFGVNEFMAVSSNAPGVTTRDRVYHISTAVNPPANGVPKILPFSTNSFQYIDGGVVDNAGLMPLIQRRLKCITVFICNAVEFFCVQSSRLESSYGCLPPLWYRD